MSSEEHRGYRSHHRPGGDADRAGPAQGVKDPVCGMTVDPASSTHKAEHAGSTYHFCCAGCRAKFLADPQRYVAGAPAEGRRSRAGRDDLHLPDAPGDPAGRAGLMPDLRHGARALDCDR